MVQLKTDENVLYKEGRSLEDGVGSWLPDEVGGGRTQQEFGSVILTLWRVCVGVYAGFLCCVYANVSREETQIWAADFREK